MCHYHLSEDDLPQNEHYARRNGNGIEHVELRWETQIALLEERISRIEARVERLETTMLYLQKWMRVLSCLLLLTLVYAICK